MKSIAFAVLALGAVAMVAPAMATPAVPKSAANQSLVQKTYYRHWHGGWHRGWHRGWYAPGWGFYGGPVVGYGAGRCYRWRRICANRWGWGGPGFGRCLYRHGC
jgi:hypothetical protein